MMMMTGDDRGKRQPVPGVSDFMILLRHTYYTNEKPEFYGIKKLLPSFFHILFYSHFIFALCDLSFILVLLSRLLKVIGVSVVRQH
jgi:hypothetical protein